MIRFLQINKPLSQLLHLLFTRKMEKPIMKCISRLLVSMSLVVILCSFEIYKLGRTQSCCICVYQSFIFSQQTFINLLCCMCLVVQSCPTLVTPQTVACLVPLPMGFSRQEYWSALPFPPRDLPDPGIEPGSPALQPDSLATELQGKLHPEAKYKKFLLVIVRSVMFKLFSLVSNKEQKVDERQ